MQASRFPRPVSDVHVESGGFVVDAHLLAGLLNLPAAEVQRSMREGRLTGMCEEGVDEHRDQFRLTFYHGNRRARLNIDRSGRILFSSTVDFGRRPLPRSLRSPGGA